MNSLQIESFLEIVKQGSITKATKTLYISQSALSNRMIELENELNTTLFIRKKGMHKIILTPMGEKFIDLANAFMRLENEAKNLNKLCNTEVLTIAGVDSVNNYTLVHFFKKFVNTNEQVQLNLKTFHSDEIYNLVAENKVDIGFTLKEVKKENVIAKPIYRELMYLIGKSNSTYYDYYPIDKLDPKMEIYLEWAPDFQLWHDRFFNPDIRKNVQVNTGSMLSKYLDSDKKWALAPMSVITILKQYSDISYYHLETTPPPRYCYMLINRNLSKEKHLLIDNFIQQIEEYIETQTDICVFEPWMDQFSIQPNKKADT
jgi:DNA-binding transcriptional LysR family regulator